MAEGFSLCHCDNALLVVDKPAELLAVPGRGPDKQDCLTTRVQRVFPEARVVHRLDMATSGLMLMARSLAMQRLLSALFEARQVDKRYVAVVSGLLAEDQGEVDLPLLADWPNRPRRIVDRQHGKPALTRYRVSGRDLARGTTRVELMPLTGRTHQLRVHMQALGHPIVGDALYGTPAARLMLHAAGLAFTHPEEGTIRRFDSPPPF